MIVDVNKSFPPVRIYLDDIWEIREAIREHRDQSTFLEFDETRCKIIKPDLINLAKDVDAIRINGNFAAHPIKSKSTGEIVEVEPGEAEWNIEVLEELFEFLYVRQKQREKRRKVFNEKLKDAGRAALLAAAAPAAALLRDRHLVAWFQAPDSRA